MHEIEVKAVLLDKDAFIARLAERGCVLGPEIVQDDTVYVREAGSIEKHLSNQDFLRIREEGNGRVLFTFKHNPSRQNDLDSAPLELELEIDSGEKLEQVLLRMGYQESVRIKKRRRKGRYQDWEVCVDEVEGLGSFVELEEMAVTRDDTAAIQERMRMFLAELGLDPTKTLVHRFDVLMLEKKYGA